MSHGQAKSGGIGLDRWTVAWLKLSADSATNQQLEA